MLFPRSIKNISGNRDSSNETRMTTRSLGQCASTLPFKNERNFARFNKDLPGFRSREIFFNATSPPCIFSSPSYFTFSTNLVENAAHLYLLCFFPLPNLPFVQQLFARNSDPWTWRIRSHKLEKSRRAACFDILHCTATNLFCYVSSPRVTDQRIAPFPYPVLDQMERNRARAILSSRDSCLAPFFHARVKAGRIEF